MRTQRTWKRGKLVVALSLLAACTGENDLDLGLITVDSVPDQFSFSVNGLDNMTGGVRYYLTVTGAHVALDMSQSVTSGTAIVQVRDGLGDIKYQEDAADDIDVADLGGTAGFWQIDIIVTKVTGGFAFTLVGVP